jgi:hypothetical protein
MSKYFRADIVEEQMPEKRKEYMTVYWDDAKGEPVVHSGVLCLKQNGQLMLNISDEIGAPVFKGIPHDRVKKVVHKGRTYTPGGE